MSEPQPSFFEKLGTWIRNSVTFKIFSIGFLILLMLIPTAMISDLIRERQYRQEEAAAEITSKWGNDQTVMGPVLSIPYKDYYKEDEEIKVVKRYAHFLPYQLDVKGKVNPLVRHRGIFEAVLYDTDLHISGTYNKPEFSNWKIKDENILWDEASISLGIPDMRGINEAINLKWNKETIAFEPGVPVADVISNGVSVPIDLSDSSQQSGEYKFDFDLSLNGSRQLYFVPLGNETNVDLTSNWPDPIFSGQFLPDTHHVTTKGFTAHWKVLQLNRNYPQQWLGNAYNPIYAAFGVDMKVGVDNYQKNTRSAKYAVMIIALTFIMFFFVEVLNKKRIHPIQYLFVGFALSIFYALLLAISEHASFGVAYLAASVAVIGLILVYVQGMLKARKLTLILGGVLVLIYGFIFVILQLQDYALLVGSIGLFIALAVVMYFTRNIDWYNVSRERKN